MDTRASDTCKRVIDRLGIKKIFEVSGNSFEPTYSTPKIIWFKENMPEVYKNTYKFLQSNSFIVITSYSIHYTKLYELLFL